MEKKRIYYFDKLRLIAISLMMLVHLAGQNMYVYNPSAWQWNVFNIYNASGRWTIQIFVMISGALLLGGHQTVSSIWKKNIARIMAAFCFWSLAYAGFYFLGGASLDKTVSDFLTGHFHLWFLPMIAGLYMLIPFLRKIVEDKKLTEYFLLLSFVFSIVIPQLVVVTGLFSEKVSSLINLTFAGFSFNFGFGYIFYFVLGYYLHNNAFDAKWNKWFYACIPVGYLLTIGLSRLLDFTSNGADTTFYGAFTINCFIMSVGIFMLGKNCFDKPCKNPKLEMFIKKLSEYSFGAYLVHALVFEQLNNRLGINTLSFNPIISVPVITAVVLLISYTFSAVCHHIPFVKKWLV